MASFVREVLTASGRLGEKEDFGGKASRLKLRVDDLKSNLRERIESRYEDFTASFNDVSIAVVQLENVIHEVEALENSVNTHLKPNLVEAGREATEVSRQLKELSHSVQMANLTKKLFEDIETANEHLEAKKYLEASALLDCVGKRLDKAQVKDDEDAKRSIAVIKKEHSTLKQKCAYVLGKDWDENVKVLPEFDSDHPDRLKSARLEINFQTNDSKLCQLVQAMHLNDILPFRIQKFAQGLINHLLKPMISKKATLEAQGTTVILHLEDHGSTRDKRFPLHVIENMETLLFVLAKQFDFALKIGEEDDNVVASQLGDLICPSAIDMLLKECLIPAVPPNMSELEEYDAVLNSTKNFRSSLIDMKLVTKNSDHAQALLKFTDNIHETFISKRCTSILVEARKLMKKDLHNSVLVKEKPEMTKEEVEEQLRTATTNANLRIDIEMEEELLPLPKGMSLNDGLFKFPTCHVSSSVIEVEKLVQTTIKEALEVKDDVVYSGRLLVTARNVYEMYNDILPISHGQSLKSFPLNSALGYNNCMYLAHGCLKIFVPAKNLPEPLKSRPLTFADLVPRLRQTGIEVFLGQMRKLRDQFRNMLRDSVTGFGQLDGSNLLPATSEKCLKQVLHQLMHLHSLWKETLPLSVFRRSIGITINTIVEELVQRVVVLEDIAADAAVQICMHFSILQEQAPKVFVIEGKSETSKGDIVRYVRKWNRFTEIIVILNASLREIEDRWASGKGPLANEFTPDEVKRLIRALFQNTDRRAGVLSRIK